MRGTLVGICCALLTACTITQEIKPISTIVDKEVCIIEDPAVRPGFLIEYRSELERKGYKVKMLPLGSSVDSCEITSTYTALWSWDLAIYMSYAVINVYRSGILAGEALYDSRSGGGNMNKFIDGEGKVRELVNNLFP